MSISFELFFTGYRTVQFSFSHLSSCPPYAQTLEVVSNDAGNNMKVPWIAKKQIAEKAYELINNFQAMAGYAVRPPIPVEDIVERYLKLTLIYEDLEKILGQNILGATYVQSRTICVNERLFEDGPEGRLVFTCAHEVGHWVLHRKYVNDEADNRSKDGAIVCTTLNARAPIEWQANYFASCLLMPEKEVREAFEKVCAPEPYVIRNSMDEISEKPQPDHPYLEHWPVISAAMCELGAFSNVSKHAMIIRLQDLGLLVNKTGKRMDWTAFG